MIGWLILAAVLALCAVLCIRAAPVQTGGGGWGGARPSPWTQRLYSAWRSWCASRRCQL